MRKINLSDSPFFDKHVGQTANKKTSVPRKELPLNVAPVGQCCDGSGWYLKAVDYNHPEFSVLQKCSCGRAGNPEYKTKLLEEDLKSYRHCTFQSWNENRKLDAFTYKGMSMGAETQKQAIDIATRKARKFAENSNGWLYIHGSYGAGKTHLAAAIGHEIANKSKTVVYRNVPSLLDNLRGAIGKSQLEQEIDRYVKADLLILDDMGVEEMTSEFMNARLFRIFDERIDKSTVITSNLDLDELNEKVGGRIASRLLQSTKIFLPISDFRKYKRKE
jgi:DNA replication protein DnaC